MKKELTFYLAIICDTTNNCGLGKPLTNAGFCTHACNVVQCKCKRLINNMIKELQLYNYRTNE